MRHKQKKTKDFSDLFLGNYSTASSFAESYRTLRTNIYFSFMEKEFRSLLVTSTGEKEGKSTTTANLAYTMAQAGKNVLMIDADLRKPMLSKVIPSHNEPGLTGLLSDTFSTDIRAGSLADFSVNDLFWLLSFQKKTGVLQLIEENEKVNIFFLHGELVDVNWLTRPKINKLASLLVREKVITKEQAEYALARRHNTGQKLGFVLINMGLVKEDDLAGFITLHMIEGLRTCLQFKSGKFSFNKLVESFFERPSYNPADLSQLYRQTIIGEEELPFLQREISASILPTDTKNLSLLPSGHRPPNPAELLESNRMSFLVSYLNRRYDILIIDTPPVLATSDALVLAPQTDGTVLIIKSGFLNREMVKKAVDQIRIAQANLIGVVLNQVDIKRGGYYKYYRKYYSEYYGKSK